MLKIKKLTKELFIPAGMLAALTIGAGFFALPRIFYEAGFALGTVYLLVFAIVISILHLMYGEVIDRTPGHHRFLGYVQIYLGPVWRAVSFISSFLGLILALLIYLVLASKLIKSFFILPSDLASVFLFMLVSAPPLFWGVRKIADLGFSITIGKIVIILAVFLGGFYAFTHNPINYLSSTDLKTLLLPYSAILFALYGRSAIGTVKDYFRVNFKPGPATDRKFEMAILTGTVVPALLYLLFIIGVLGVSGLNVSEDAISGLKSAPILWIGAGLLGLISIWAAYVFVEFELNAILVEDFKLKKGFSYFFTIAAPVGLYLLGLNNLLGLIGLSGGVFVAAESIMIILMWDKIRRPSVLTKALAWLLVLMFVAGAGFEISRAF